MGLAELLLGKENPFTKWVGENQNYVSTLGAGLGQGQNLAQGLGIGLSGVPQAKALDRRAQGDALAKAEQEKSRNQTLEMLKSRYPDLAAAFEAGAPMNEIWGQALQRMKPQAAAAPLEINGQLVDPTTFKVLGDFRTPETPKAPTAPSGYSYADDGRLSFIPGGPADPATQSQGKPTDAQRRAAALSQVVENDAMTLLGDGTPGNPGAFDAMANLGDQALNADIGGVKPLRGFSAPDYQRATNALTNIAQSYLYAISGQAAPAGEVAKIIDSVTPKPFESAAAVAEKKQRLASYIDAIKMEQAKPQGSAADSAGQTDTDAILKKYGL